MTADTATAIDGRYVVLPGQTPEGGEILSVLLKRTFTIEHGRDCVRADEDQPITSGEVFWDTPMNSTVRFESDFAPWKPQTDVVFIARAWASDGEPVQRCDVSVQVGDRRKVIQVTGDRRALFTGPDSDPVFTDPEPFTDMGLRYERAYGGIDVFSDKSTLYPYPRNPMGSGFVLLNTKESVDQMLLPNLEDPADPLTPQRLCIGEFARWSGQPMPMGFGWVPKTNQPRSLLAGILPADRAVEQQMRAAYALLVPTDQREAYLQNGLPDMDFRFFNGASEGLAFPYLQGGEVVRTENLSPEGRLAFRLPADRPRIGLHIGKGIESPEVVLHTVQVRLEEREVDLVWRAAVPYPGRDWLPQMRKFEVFVE
ncbi:DUF2169 domain-containing protein [Variovorax rhizosphaerae]|uniref:DUF2169 domain-containing protein n=1 Tax=Variovorax rhizosphaerae TaxID=1836200 RepID=A0ABU8WDJ3_9BURK